MYTSLYSHMSLVDRLKASERQLFDRSRVPYFNLMRFKQNNIQFFKNNYEAQLQMALIESCYTYVYEHKFNLQGRERHTIVNSLTKAKKGFRNLKLNY